MINVTKTYLPPLEEYVKYLERIWVSGQVTNNGELVRELESQLADYLGVKHVIVVANGTLALQLAIRALDLNQGEIITTPFSYVATTSAILWEGYTPRYVDINSNTFNIDVEQIELAITEHTRAILPVHVFGRPCDVSQIGEIAKRHGLPVIYDAAHAFGTQIDGRAVVAHGDVSMFSFHATKLFHTVEGGALVTEDDKLARKIRLCRSFGHIGDEHHCLGVNAKMSELHAAMGLCMLERVDGFISRRAELTLAYNRLLDGLPLERLAPLEDNVNYNHAYYPALLPSEMALEQVVQRLKARDIHPRRYFYPSLNRLSYLTESSPCPVSEDVVLRVLCLPFYPDLGPDVQREVADEFSAVLHSRRR